MHVNHLILVKAEDKGHAIIEAESFLECYGEGQVWDWYAIGGRWSWVKGDNTESNKFKEGNVLAVKGNEKKVKQMIKDCMKIQLDEIKRYNADLIEAMKKHRITRLQDITPEHSSMLGHYLHGMGELLAGYYCFDSMFFDVEWGAAYIDDKRIKEIVDNPEELFIVNVDLHN